MAGSNEERGGTDGEDIVINALSRTCRRCISRDGSLSSIHLLDLKPSNATRETRRDARYSRFGLIR